jgi:hypothetical protein
VKRFLRAINDKDLNLLLTCVDAKQERMFRASLRLIEKFTGGRLPVDDLLELVPGLYQLLQDRASEDINVRVVRVGKGRVTGEAAEVPATLIVSTTSRGLENAQEHILRFMLRRFKEGWRIVGIQKQ